MELTQEEIQEWTVELHHLAKEGPLTLHDVFETLEHIIDVEKRLPLPDLQPLAETSDDEKDDERFEEEFTEDFIIPFDVLEGHLSTINAEHVPIPTDGEMDVIIRGWVADMSRDREQKKFFLAEEMIGNLQRRICPHDDRISDVTGFEIKFVS